MTTVHVDGFDFVFEPGWQVSAPDKATFYRGAFAKMNIGIKAVDLLVLDPGKTLWLTHAGALVRRRPGPAKRRPTFTQTGSAA